MLRILERAAVGVGGWLLGRAGFVRCEDCGGWFTHSHACGSGFGHIHVVVGGRQIGWLVKRRGPGHPHYGRRNIRWSGPSEPVRVRLFTQAEMDAEGDHPAGGTHG